MKWRYLNDTGVGTGNVLSRKGKGSKEPQASLATEKGQSDLADLKFSQTEEPMGAQVPKEYY